MCSDYSHKRKSLEKQHSLEKNGGSLVSWTILATLLMIQLWHKQWIAWKSKKFGHASFILYMAQDFKDFWIPKGHKYEKMWMQYESLNEVCHPQS